jgi:hypothetical protein
MYYKWPDFWAWFEVMPSDHQREALLQLDLVNHLQKLSAACQKKVLDGAPQGIVDWARPHLKVKDARSLQDIRRVIAGI